MAAPENRTPPVFHALAGRKSFLDDHSHIVELARARHREEHNVSRPHFQKTRPEIFGHRPTMDRLLVAIGLVYFGNLRGCEIFVKEPRGNRNVDRFLNVVFASRHKEQIHD